MQYTHLATITTKPGQMRDLLRKMETELLSTYRHEPGFVALTVAQTGDNTAVSFGVWQTHEQAERSIKSLDTWAKDGVGHLIDSVHSHGGELPFFAFTDELKVYASPAPAAAARN
jgi:quinol monooxygenase YgiN